MEIFRAYKTEIDPNNVQRTALLKHAGVARVTYNWGLARRRIGWIKLKESGYIPTNISCQSQSLDLLVRSYSLWAVLFG